jgi:acetoacetyl-CoA synthetase
LLLVLKAGTKLDRSLTLKIKKELNTKGSPNHVPAVIAQVDALPMTHSGKFSEKAVRDVLNGKALSNREAMKNPESIDAIALHPELRI